MTVIWTEMDQNGLKQTKSDQNGTKFKGLICTKWAKVDPKLTFPQNINRPNMDQNRSK